MKIIKLKEEIEEGDEVKMIECHNGCDFCNNHVSLGRHAVIEGVPEDSDEGTYIFVFLDDEGGFGGMKREHLKLLERDISK